MHYEYEQEKFELISSMKEDGKTMEEILPESEKLRVKWLEMYNTEEESKIIKEHFHVFLYKVDFPTRSQMVRHRVNIQELSRRYLSGERESTLTDNAATAAVSAAVSLSAGIYGFRVAKEATHAITSLVPKGASTGEMPLTLLIQNQRRYQE
jgi:hypothetical protein